MFSDSTGKIDVFCECENQAFKNQDKILVSGTVKVYSQYLQITADKIIKE